MLRAWWAIIILLGASLAAAAFPSPANKPVTRDDILYLLNNYVSSQSVTNLVKENGIDFDPQEDYLKKVRAAGGKDELIEALRNAHGAGPHTGAVTRTDAELQVEQHLARALELEKLESYPQSEQEYRAALAIEPQNSTLHVGLGRALSKQEKWRKPCRNIVKRYVSTRSPRRPTAPWVWQLAREAILVRPFPNSARLWR